MNHSFPSPAPCSSLAQAIGLAVKLLKNQGVSLSSVCISLLAVVGYVLVVGSQRRRQRHT